MLKKSKQEPSQFTDYHFIAFYKVKLGTFASK